MRAILLLLLSGAFLAGCKNPRPEEPSAARAGTTARTQAERAPARSPGARDFAAQAPQPIPINEPAGQVASVNPALRFVVIDFGFNPVPQTDQRLSVYRQGQKVGEVRISSQARNSIIAADITAGEAGVGDEVRPD